MKGETREKEKIKIDPWSIWIATKHFRRQKKKKDGKTYYCICGYTYNIYSSVYTVYIVFMWFKNVGRYPLFLKTGYYM